MQFSGFNTGLLVKNKPIKIALVFSSGSACFQLHKRCQTCISSQLSFLLCLLHFHCGTTHMVTKMVPKSTPTSLATQVPMILYFP